MLRRIARDGRDGFYEGEVAEDMVASLRALGGTHTLDDFAATACAYVEPIAGAYRGHELVELPPNGQGATAILLAKILGASTSPRLDPLGAARAHLEAEATKLAYDARDRFVADPDAGAAAARRTCWPTRPPTGSPALIDPRPGAARARPRRRRRCTATRSISASSTATAWRCR